MDSNIFEIRGRDKVRFLKIKRSCSIRSCIYIVVFIVWILQFSYSNIRKLKIEKRNVSLVCKECNSFIWNTSLLRELQYGILYHDFPEMRYLSSVNSRDNAWSLQGFLATVRSEGKFIALSSWRFQQCTLLCQLHKLFVSFYSFYLKHSLFEL